MDKTIKEENLKGMFPSCGNIIIGGETERKHDKNIEEFLKVVKKRNLTLNDSKTISKLTTLNTFGTCVRKKWHH